jgi:hypothetical protein
MNATCPDMTALLDHMEGRADLGEHLVSCEPCSQALGDLRGALSVESALVATGPFEVEHALVAVKERARKNRAARWRTSAFFSAAAAVTLALLLPGKLVPATAGPGPEGGAGGGAYVNRLPLDVDVENPVNHDPLVKRILDVGSTTTAAIHS